MTEFSQEMIKKILDLLTQSAVYTNELRNINFKSESYYSSPEELAAHIDAIRELKQVMDTPNEKISARDLSIVAATHVMSYKDGDGAKCVDMINLLDPHGNCVATKSLSDVVQNIHRQLVDRV